MQSKKNITVLFNQIQVVTILWTPTSNSASVSRRLCRRASTACKPL